MMFDALRVGLGDLLGHAETSKECHNSLMSAPRFFVFKMEDEVTVAVTLVGAPA